MGIPNNPVLGMWERWTKARLELAELEHAEHPNIVDRFGRVWEWFRADIYRHDNTLAADSGQIEKSNLPPATDNPNYARLCLICRSGWTSEERAILAHAIIEHNLKYSPRYQ